MSVRINGRINLLSGHYQDIIISEYEDEDFSIKVTPDKLQQIDKLDNSYSHINYNGIRDKDKVNTIVDYYLNNNNIFMYTIRGHLKYHYSDYCGVNAYNTLIDGYRSVSKALYLKLDNNDFSEIFKKITNKYKEDRIRYLDKLLNCNKITVSLDLRTSSYYISNNQAYISLLSQVNPMKYGMVPIGSENDFLKLLVLEFYKINGSDNVRTRYPDETVEIYSNDCRKVLTADRQLFKKMLEIKNEYDKTIKELDNVSIEEYQKTIKLK